MEELNNRRYYPNVSSLHATCDSNYVRLLKLLPEVDVENMQYEFGVHRALHYRIEIVECARYTTTLEMSQLNPEFPKYLKPSMRIRLYHDARMAEVVESQNIARFESSYHYPNKHMHQKNEKEMVNQFLSEWLSFCLAQRAPLESAQSI